MFKKLICMTEKETARHIIIQNLLNRRINGSDAAKQMGLSVRQTKRIKARVKEKGVVGLIHKSRGKSSNRKFSDSMVSEIKKHIEEKYYDFGPTFAAEKLHESHKIKINKESLRILMVNAGLWTIRHKKNPKNKHFWRARKENYGEMEQFDGSYHKWFGNETSCLLASIDDATGKITHAKFGYHESVKEVFGFWQEYFNLNGSPLSIYLDKFSTYKINHKNAVDNSEMLTQFQRAMNQSNVKMIVAHSPQAKGRIERLFNTLQDRLVKELRLNNITTMDEANKFLKTYISKFNEKFAVVPNKRANIHKPISAFLKEKLPQIFSIQEKRIVNNDYTVMFKTKIFLLDDIQPTTVYKKDTVIIEEHLNGEIKINCKEHYLNYQELFEKPKKEIEVNLAAVTTKKPSNWKPPKDHPWRKFIVNPRKRYQTSS